MDASGTETLSQLESAPQTGREDDSGDFAPGTLLGGSYRLVRRLGRGGMGDIHLATHERLPGQFVVKVLSPDLVSDQDAFVRFRQEAVVMANVRHPNVVQLIDFNFTAAGLPYLVMEYLPGKDLADILATRPFLAAAQVSSIVRQVACALDAAHRLGIVHRDLKPENIMVVPCEGQGDLIKVIDFGISKARRFNHVTSASMVMGTPEFMSPEQAQGRHEDIDARSDQFALAVISYLLLTGRTPWGATAPVEILHRVVNNDALPLNHDGSWPSIEAVLLRGMAKAPFNRYPSTLAFWRALDRAMASDGLLPAATGYTPTMHGPGYSAGGPQAVSRSPHSPHSEELTVLSAPAAACDPIPSDAHPSQLGDDTTAEQFPTSTSLAAEESALVSAMIGSADPDDRRKTTVTAAISRRSRRQAGRRRRHTWQVGVLLAALVFGAYVGLQDVPAARARVGTSWGVVRGLAAHAMERAARRGRRWLSSVKAVSDRSYLVVGADR